jgi:hypothetical protein
LDQDKEYISKILNYSKAYSSQNSRRNQRHLLFCPGYQDQLIEIQNKMAQKNHRQQNKQTLTSLLLANLFTIVIAVLFRWDLIQVLWIYWGQSLIIGYFNWRRMQTLDNFSTEGLRMNNRAVEPTRKTQKQIAHFFVLHYGGFHIIYLVFIAMETARVDALYILVALVCVIAFYFNHRLSFQNTVALDRQRVPNIGTMMFSVYPRIIPMHLLIVFGGAVAGGSMIALVIFLILKTLADVAMHFIMHRKDPKLTSDHSVNAETD